MRREGLLVVVMLLAAGCSLSVADSPGTTQATRAAWEYKQDVLCIATHLPASEHQAKIGSLLEQRGREGWELISSSPSGSESETCYLLIFKRQTM